MGERILVVEDESTLCTNIARYLGRAGHVVTAVETGQAALTELDARSFDLVITDLRLPDVDGLTVLDRVRATSPETVTLIMTAYASVDSAVEALRRGAHDYVLKPLSLADLQRKVAHIAEYKRLGQENARLRALMRSDKSAVATLRRGGREMNELCDMIERAASSSSNLLLFGESGTGKELVARAIHETSPHAEGPFVNASMTSIPDADVESFLFGDVSGRTGVFRTASGGTLFLDEIGELPLPIQAKLLRAVESKEILPLGADRAVTVDVRIVAATHRDLAAMTREGTFRRDLLHRLQVVELRVPALRDRAADIPALAKDLLERHARSQRKPVRAIAPDAMALLCSYEWPGNVRELSNVIERAVILSTDDLVTAVDLPVELRARGAAPVRAETASAPDAHEVDNDLERATLAFQKKHIARVLDSADGNRELAAKLLGLSPATFYRYLQKLGLKGYTPGSSGDDRHA